MDVIDPSVILENREKINRAIMDRLKQLDIFEIETDASPNPFINTMLKTLLSYIETGFINAISSVDFAGIIYMSMLENENPNKRIIERLRSVKAINTGNIIVDGMMSLIFKNYIKQALSGFDFLSVALQQVD